ncbi:tyrosine-type recombinase/integrase [Flaviaesturariibacter aridisoli]|uniref:Tyr recombinase domain-containing protein n=1 Tax=Flaviaesturariibacter aridisoli TaxID=2545761 RepID=A0A4R4DWG7_9BACT|nr:tyrosine-type recombinase/integrase [Flaviaesturariibacter aridisoli]TCZ65031.1 hypothetical protein E0486_17845 [Flaviaesturariibacter aridisoli]
MPTKTTHLLPLFREFSSKSEKGHRLRYPGKKLAPGTIRQYQQVYQLLEQFEELDGQPVRIAVMGRPGITELQKEKRYWQRFLRHFLDFLYTKKRHSDNYVASVLKTLRACFNYIAQDKQLPIGTFHTMFKVPSPTIEPVILSPQQLQFLIYDQAFHENLPRHLRRTKDLFVFGCTVGLRYSDLMALQKKNLVSTQQGWTLNLRTQKTGTAVQIPFPDYLEAILDKYRATTGRFLLPRLSSTNMNKQVKDLCRRAGWNQPLPKMRSRRGKMIEQRCPEGNTQTFADQVTAHTMRRTAITTLLILGVPELAVRRISGHAPGSKEFYRYVIIAQEYVNQHIRKAFQLLAPEARKTA